MRCNCAFELLVAVLQLLDRAGEFTNLRLETADPLRNLLTRTLRDGALLLRLRALLLARCCGARSSGERRSLLPKRSLRNPCADAAQGAMAMEAAITGAAISRSVLRNIGPDLP